MPALMTDPACDRCDDAGILPDGETPGPFTV